MVLRRKKNIHARHAGKETESSLMTGMVPYAFLLMLALPATALAEEGTNPLPQIPKSALQALAKKFVDKIGAGLETADELLSGQNKVAIAEKMSRTEIPDGENLIMQTVILTDKKKLPLNHEILAYKDNGALYISLTEFFSAADFAIAVDAGKGTASGWFIRED